MPNINLINDTGDEFDRPAEKKPAPPPEMKFSKPLRDPKPDPTPDLPPEKSGVLSSLKSAFNRPKSSGTEDESEPVAMPSRPPQPRPTPPTPMSSPADRPAAVPKQSFQAVPSLARPAATKPAPPAKGPAPMKTIATPDDLGDSSVTKPSFLARVLSKLKSNVGNKKPPADDSAGNGGDSFFNVNLMPGTVADSDLRKKVLSLAVVGGACVLLMVVVFGLLLWYESGIKRQGADVTADIDAVEREIALLRDDQKASIALKSTTDQIRQLLDNHIYWTQFFSKLAEHTASDVYFVSFSGTPRGDITLVAHGPDFSAPARQLLLFEAADDFVGSVTINSATLTSLAESERSEVTFTVQLRLVDGVFVRPAMANGGTDAAT